MTVTSLKLKKKPFQTFLNHALSYINRGKTEFTSASAHLNHAYLVGSH